MMNQYQTATRFKSLHIAGSPLILYNIWDAGGAKAIADAGAAAIATGSWAIAAAHGFEDGQDIPLDFVLQIIHRIATTVNLPLSVDFEGGYAVAPEAITANVRRVISAGAIGINFEDQIVNGQGLNTIPDQIARIKAVRKAAELEGIPIFINARTDVFLKAGNGADHAGLMDEAKNRAKAYAEAGADGFFVPGLTDPSLIARITNETSLPTNVMMAGSLSSIDEVTSLGIARISYGPASYLSAMNDISDRFRTI